MLDGIANGKTLIRLLLKKKSDLILRCLSSPLQQPSSVGNFRTSTAHAVYTGSQLT